jgi:four helix bundle protein
MSDPDTKVGFRSYRDLLVWQRGVALALDCYRFSKKLPKEEMYGLTSQIRRASVSIPANIAEGHGRELTGSFVHHLRIAQGSLKELETELLILRRQAMWILCSKQPTSLGACCAHSYAVFNHNRASHGELLATRYSLLARFPCPTSPSSKSTSATTISTP